MGYSYILNCSNEIAEKWIIEVDGGFPGLEMRIRGQVKVDLNHLFRSSLNYTRKVRIIKIHLNLLIKFNNDTD